MPQVIRRARRQYRTPLSTGNTALSAGILPLRSRVVARREALYEFRKFTRRGSLPTPGDGPLKWRRVVKRTEDLLQTTARVFRRKFVFFTPVVGGSLAVIPRERIARQEAFLITPNARRFRTPMKQADVPTAGGDFVTPRQTIQRQNQIEEARRFPRARFPKIVAIPPPPIPLVPRAKIKRRDDLTHLPHRFFHRLMIRRIFATASGADSLRYYFTGAAGDGAGQDQQEGCLGNFRSSTEANRVGFLVSTPIPNVQILAAARHNAVEDDGGIGLGTGIVTASGPNKLRYLAPGSVTAGPEVTFTNGQTDRLDDGDDKSDWIRVKRTSADQLAGSSSVEFLDLYNDVFGMSDGVAAGSNNYRAIMLRNEFSANITNLKLFVKPLISTSVTSSVSQLGAAGSGTISGVTDCFCKWPFKGWARVETSGGSLREIVYYSSRTDSSLTVPALGRGRLGTSAGAGASSDKIWSVPGIRIGFETASPAVGGSVQTIANETTAPNTAAFIGTAWSTAITAATGINVGTLIFQSQGGLWVHRELPAGVSAISKALNLIGVSFTADGIAYSELLAGMYRIADTAIERYEIHIGVGAEPNLNNPPTETTATLPYDTTYTIPPSTIVYVAVNFRNRYDLVSQNMETTVIQVNGSNSETSPAPIAPTIVLFTPAAGGTFHLLADYDYLSDPEPGDNWKIYATTNGLDPTTSDLLATVAITRGGSIGRVRLDYTTGAYAGGTTVKVRVAIFRSSDSALSALSATATAIAETSGPSAPTGVIGQRKNFLQDQS